MSITLESIKLNKKTGSKEPLIQETSLHDIAIIGMSGVLPQASNMAEFWQNIIEKKLASGELPENRKRDVENYLRYKGSFETPLYQKASYLKEIDKFDYKFFNFTPREAGLMNPVQRLFLETSWAALEDAGYGGAAIKGTKTGIYLGYISDLEGYKYKQIITDVEDQITQEIATAGNLSAITASRLSYHLDLKGPSMMVDTACSSSLVALHLACQGLRNNDCDMALVGGVRLNILPVDDGFKTGIESPDGVTKAFDEAANGTAIGEGVVAIMVKPLVKAEKDKDHIYAVIKGSAINQDGTSMGITAPNAEAQKELLVQAWKNAGINPEQLDYIEAHGTGTQLGDPIEMDGIIRSFRQFTDKNSFCAINSVKANIGHLYDIAGLVGLIKATLALKNESIPPGINFNSPNKKINFEESPVYVNDQFKVWNKNGHKRCCAVSSFGFSGTNCHVVVEEYTGKAINASKTKEQYLVPFSAKSHASLVNQIKQFRLFLDKSEKIDFLALCNTLAKGRMHFSHRLAILAESLEELKIKLRQIDFEKDKPEEKIYFGNKLSGQSVEEINELSEKANSLLYSPQDVKLDELAKLYIQGADINWTLLYTDKAKLSLPTYPFEKHRCWVNIPETEQLNDGYFYNLNWIKAESETEIQKALPKDQTLVVFHKSSWSDRLKNSEEFASASYFEINEKFSPYALPEKIVEGENRILFIPEYVAEIKSVTELQKYQKNNLHVFQTIVKEIIAAKPEVKLEIDIITNQAYKVLEIDKVVPQQRILAAFAQSMEKELSNIVVKVLDVDSESSIPDCLFWLNNHKNTLGAVRKGQFFIKEFQAVSEESFSSNELNLKQEGVYIITGGTGGMGLEISKFLVSKQHSISIALLGRSEVPVKDGNLNEKWQKAFKVADSLIATGANLQFYQADVTEPQSLNNLITDLKQKFGKINGIIHCAGISKETSVLDKTTKEIESVLAPKVYGTYNLYEVTREEKLDFFILSSSVASVFTAPLQSDYAAANAYLDAFAENHSEINALNWVFWNETGMASDKGVATDTLFKSLNNQEAIESFEKVLNFNKSNLLIGKLNYQSGFIRVLENSPYQIEKTVENTISYFKTKQKAATDHKLELTSEQVKLTGKEDASYNEIEVKIASICKKILGFDEININDSFFDLGADSILLTRIYELIEKEYPGKLTVAKVFAHPSIAALSAYLDKQLKGEQPNRTIEFKKNENREIKDIAVIGMAVKLKGVETLDEFWEMLSTGKDCVEELPDARKEDVKNFLQTKYGSSNGFKLQDAAYINEIDKFDYRLFRLSPRESGLMDPNQRLFLQTAMSAIEDAGYGGNKLNGSKTGVFLGFSNNSNCQYIDYVLESNPDDIKSAVPANLTSLIPSRIAYLLNLRGPSMIIDTACSSALVSIHQACKSIREGECEYALAGGVKLKLLPIDDDTKIGIESSDFRTRSFDDSSDGTGMGEGVGAVFLKLLDKAIEDNDSIYSVIKGSAINQDGTSVGITAPNGQAQTELLVDAWTSAGVNPESISYIEAHGTGTKLGDPIEIESLQEAFEQFTPKKNFCAISSVKSNIGHLFECAGVVGLIKASLSLQKEKLAPSVHFNMPNHRINFEDTALFVNDKLLPWKKNGENRRCGISAFGFSGTNCHVVLEEAPAVTNVEKNKRGLPSLLTISAKSEEQIKQTATNYLEFLNRNSEVELNDICYTANTGRGQFEHRVVIIANNLTDVKDKLKSVSEGNYEFENVFYKHFRIVDESKTTLEEGEITDALKRKLTAEALAKFQSEAGNLENDTILDIINLYLKGADINWEHLYEGQKPKRLHLPVYPFEKNRCWVKNSQNKNTITESVEFIHPLLQRCAVKSIDQDIYITNYKVETHFSLSDHKVLGDFVIPGANYPDVAKQVSKLYYGDVEIELRELSFFMPVFCKEGDTRQIQNIVKKEEDHLQLTVVSQPDRNSEEWVKHCSVKIYKLENAKPLTFDIEKLKKECNKEVLENIDVNELTHGFFEYGPRWENYHTLRVGENTALAEFEFPREYLQELDTYYLHPGLIDMSVGAWALTLKKKYVPLAYKSFRIFGPTPARYYSYIKRKDEGEEYAEVIRYDVTLIGEDGVAFGEITDFAIKKADRFKDIAVDSQYAKVSWNRQINEIDKFKDSGEPVLIFVDKYNVHKHFVTQLSNYILVKPGEGYKELNDREFTIGHSQEDYDKIISILKEKKILRIIHISGIQQEHNNTLESLETALNNSVRSLFKITKAVLINEISTPIYLDVVMNNAHSVTGAEEIIYPECGAGLAMAKVISNEMPNINCISIDIDNLTDDMANEILALSTGLYSYREGVRYTAEVDSFEIEEVEDDPIEIKTEGAYLITGGASGIGKEISGFFTNFGNVKLCLTGRSSIPERSEWNNVSEGNGNQKSLSIIQTIKELEEKGAQVEYFAVDATDLEEMQKVRDEIVSKHGKLNGIVHSAGIAGDGFIMSKDEETFNKVLSPKIKGTWVLDKITGNDELDFFVSFSSIASVMRLPGQSDYTAANAYLDSFAAYRKTLEKAALTINWPAWKETGMAVDHNMNIDTLFKSMPTFKGIHLFESALNKDISNVILGEVNYGIFNGDGLLPASFFGNLDFSLGKAIDKHRKKLKTTTKKKSVKSTNVKLTGKSSSFNDIEMRVSALWAEVLGLEEIDVHTNFFDLGGDSIIATQLQKLIEEEFPGVLDITDVFSYATVSKMSEHIKSKTSAEEPEETFEETLKPDSMDDELDDLLSQLESGELSVDDAEMKLSN